ncbi:hypothetical protein ACSUZJ_10870 [Telluria sp. B2]
MKIAVHLARHRRLLALGGLSLLLHLLVLAWIAPRLDAAAYDAAGTPIALRLQRVAPPADVAPEPAVQPALPSPPPRPASQVAPPTSTALPPLQPLLPAPSGSPSAAVSEATADDPAPGAAPLQMPGRYLVRMPPSARLRYSMSRALPGRPPSDEGEAQLVWEAEGGHYQLRVEGVLGLLESEGGGDDAGIAPSLASEHQQDGSDRITRFDRAAGRIEFEAGAGSAPLHLGSQDRASVLMQLAGMGLAQPEQMQDVIEIVVGGPGGAQVARFRVLGREELATGAGRLATVRLAELAGPRMPRLELWLAPGYNWMPVQLRVTEPDGTVANQVLSQAETAPAPPAQAM